MDILMKIQNDYLLFSEKEKHIADYILKYSDQLQNMNINELSKRVGTSNATITRFAKKIACKSYADMKFKIHTTIAPTEEKEKKGITDEVFSFYQTVIKNTQNLIDMEKLATLATMLNKAKRIYIYGVGTSGMSGNTLALRFMRMGYGANGFDEVHKIVMSSRIATKDDLIIALSNSGTTKELIHALTLAKANKTKIISITSYSQNPIAELSDLALFVYNTKFIRDQKFVNSQFSLMYLIDVMTTYLLEDAQLFDTMKKTRLAISDLD